MAPKLYTYRESGNCYKVRLLAALLSIQLEHVEMDYQNGEHHSPEFLAINPQGALPVLVDGDKVFTDSAAILVYLAGTYPARESKLAPTGYWSSDVLEQAFIVNWLAFASTWIQNGVCKARGILSFNGAATEQALSEAQEKGRRSLEILEQQLEKNQWLTLGRPTIADVAVFVYVALAPMGDVSLDPYRAVRAWVARVRKLEGFIPIEGLDDPMYRRRRA